MRPSKVIIASEGDKIGSAAWENEEIGIVTKCSKEELVTPPEVITVTGENEEAVQLGTVKI